jgi:hypothetical protein
VLDEPLQTQYIIDALSTHHHLKENIGNRQNLPSYPCRDEIRQNLTKKIGNDRSSTNHKYLCTISPEPRVDKERAGLKRRGRSLVTCQRRPGTHPECSYIISFRPLVVIANQNQNKMTDHPAGYPDGRAGGLFGDRRPRGMLG